MSPTLVSVLLVADAITWAVAIVRILQAWR